MSRRVTCTMKTMPKMPVPMRAAGAALAVLLSACGSGHDDDVPAVEVTELAAGTYAVSVGNAANPAAGKYYAAADGSRLLVLNDGAQLATAMYERAAGGKWQATPGVTENTRVDLLHNSATPGATVAIATLARGYSVRLAAGGVAAFTLNANGEIVAGGSTCKLSGKVTTSPLPNALKLSLAATGCGDLPAQSDGWLIVDGDYAPAAFRLVTAGPKAPVDLWAYGE